LDEWHFKYEYVDGRVFVNLNPVKIIGEQASTFLLKFKDNRNKIEWRTRRFADEIIALE